MELKEYQIVKYIKNDTKYHYIFTETEEGLYVKDEEKNITYPVSNFILRLNNKNEEENRYYFDLKYVNKKSKKYIETDHQFIYQDGESLNNAVRQVNCKAHLNPDSTKHKYFKIYIENLINEEDEIESKNLRDSKENTEIIKNCLKEFMQFIDGKENQYIEDNYENEQYSFFCNMHRIENNKDLYLIKHKKQEEKYKKIGFEKIEDGEKYYYIHSPSFINILKKWCKDITTTRLNAGLRNLDIFASEGNVCSCKSSNKEVSMNLAKLYADELKKLAYKKDEIEIEKEPEPKPIEPITTESESEDEFLEQFWNESNEIDIKKLLKFWNDWDDLPTLEDIEKEIDEIGK